MYEKKQPSKPKRCNGNVYCRDILLFLLLYPCTFTGENNSGRRLLAAWVFILFSGYIKMKPYNNIV